MAAALLGRIGLDEKSGVGPDHLADLEAVLPHVFLFKQLRSGILPRNSCFQEAKASRPTILMPVFSVPMCGGTLRVIACVEDPPLIAKILGHVRRREARFDSTPRAPPDSLPRLHLT